MKLLHRTVKGYLLYSLLVLLIAIPVFYIIISSLCMQDVDEALRSRRRQLSAQLAKHPEILDSLPWQDFNHEMTISQQAAPAAGVGAGSSDRYLTVNGQAEPFRELHTIIRARGRTYPAVLRISLIGIEDLTQGIVLTTVLLIAVILVGLLWINRHQSKRIWRPFYQLLRQLQNLTLDQAPTLEFKPTDIDEFRDLQSAIGQLTSRNYRTYLQQKEFTENASHEMQTPLAIFQAKLEVLMQDETLDRAQSGNILALADSVARMTKLNKTLLLLAKIENRQFQETEDVDLAAVVRKSLAQMDLQLKFRNLEVTENLEELVVRTNPALVDILVTNLVTNAIQHATEGGTLTVATFPGRLELTNPGPALPFPEENLFQRFQKNRRRGAAGNGLGLAIIKQICDTCHFSITHLESGGIHHFVIRV